MLKDMVCFLAFLVPIVGCFANAVFLLVLHIKREDNNGTTDVYGVFISVAEKTMEWSLDGVGGNDFIEAFGAGNNNNIRIFTKMTLAFFTLTVTLLLMNMLIAMMTNSYQAIADDADNEWCLIHAEKMSTYALYAPQRWLDKCYRKVKSANGLETALPRGSFAHDTEDESSNYVKIVRERMNRIERMLEDVLRRQAADSTIAMDVDSSQSQKSYADSKYRFGSAK